MKQGFGSQLTGNPFRKPYSLKIATKFVQRHHTTPVDINYTIPRDWKRSVAAKVPGESVKIVFFLRILYHLGFYLEEQLFV